MLNFLGHGLAILLLTVVTQIGGLAWLAALMLRRALFRRRAGGTAMLLGLFLLCYGTATMVLHAGLIGERVALPCRAQADQHLVVATPLFCVLNRHYVTPETYYLVDGLTREMNERFPGTVTQVLDAGFPFLDGLPMLPHLSHDDGRDVDLAFYYQGPDGTYRPGTLPSPIGYWGFTPPRPGEPQPCAGRNDFPTLRWDMHWFQPLVRDDLTLDEARTREALRWLVAEGDSGGRLDRILLEPHLKQRLGISSQRVRFQGCRAARHDDHIHIESRY